MSEITLTSAEHLTAIKRGHRAAAKGQHSAGLAVFAAESAGMLTFDRPEAGKPLPEGVMTRGSLAKALDCSPTLISKYRGIGRLDAYGIKPGHADYTFAVSNATTAWMTEALDAGKAATEQAIADHRPGSNAGQGGKAGKNVKGKKSKKAAPKAPAATVTRATVEADVARVTRWLTANNGQRLQGLSVESLDSIHAMLADASEAVEAAKVARVATVPVAV